MQFNLKRFKQLLTRDLVIYKKPLLYFIFGSFIILGLITAISIIDSEYHMLGNGYWEGWFGILLFGGGLLLTSVIFWEFKSPAGRVQYLSIPASNFEKCLSRWLYSLILYPIVICLILIVLRFVSDAITNPISNDFSWDPFKEMTKGYYLLHSVLFVFSIWFNKYVAPKTAITGFALAILTVVLFYIAHRIFFYDLYEGIFQIDTHRNKMLPKPEFQSYIEGIVPSLVYAALIIIPAFFYVVSYFKMKEKVA